MNTTILGGGIIGLFTAYYLRQEGIECTIVDQGPIESAASHGNCGLVSPSHALPLNDPTLIFKAIKWLLKSDSPFYIRPSTGIGQLQWFLQFSKNSSKTQVERSTQGRHNLLQLSRELYNTFFSAHQINCDWSDKGILFLFKEKKTFHSYQRINAALSQELNLAAVPYGGSELSQLEPAIRPDVYGGFHYENDASLRPDRLVKALKEILLESGVSFIDQEEVISFTKKGKSISQICTDSGHMITTSNLVLATGATTPLLLKKIGVNVPIQPGKGYSITIENAKKTPAIPCIFEERKVVMTPWENSYRLGGTMEFSGYHQKPNPKRFEALIRAADEYLHDHYTGMQGKEWTGYRPMTTDELPIIDRLPQFDNVYVASGHGMLGLSMAPGTGKVLSELILNKETAINSDFYTIDRFYSKKEQCSQ